MSRRPSAQRWLTAPGLRRRWRSARRYMESVRPSMAESSSRTNRAASTSPLASMFTTAFTHVFAGGYAAGYYGYKWAEVLDADAFALFREKGIFDRETATLFRREVLERGNADDPMNLYKRFRGREPKVEALLERDGLLPEKK